MDSGAPMGADQARHLEWARTHVINGAIVARNSATQTAATIRMASPQMAGSNRATAPWMSIAARSLRDCASIRLESAQLRKIRKSCAKLPRERPDPFAHDFSSPSCSRRSTQDRGVGASASRSSISSHRRAAAIAFAHQGSAPYFAAASHRLSRHLRFGRVAWRDRVLSRCARSNHLLLFLPIRVMPACAMCSRLQFLMKT
jgi:hypothetical protein